ncbi:MAG: tetratricopeptide repeat protein [Bryobacteraceae bacterium]
MTFRPVAVVASTHAALLLTLCAQQPVDLEPSQLPIEPSARSRVEHALHERNYPEAEAILIRDAQGAATSSKLLCFLGKVFFLDRKFLNSAVALTKADKLEPLSEADRYTLAMAFAALGRPDLARADLEKLRGAQPKNALYVYWLGKLDFEEQNLPDAIEKFEEAIRLDGGFVKAHDMLGVSKDVAGEYDEAARHLEDANRLNRASVSPSPWPPLDYGDMLLRQGEPWKAEPYLREALRYEEKLAKAHYLLASALEGERKNAEAVEQLKRAAELDVSYPEPWYALARLYRKAGQAQEVETALAEYEKRAKAAEPQGARSEARP